MFAEIYFIMQYVANFIWRLHVAHILNTIGKAPGKSPPRATGPLLTIFSIFLS